MDTERATQVLDSAPVIRLLKALFDSMHDKGIRLTPKGNLPLRQVDAMIEAGGEAVLPAWFHAGFGRVRSEQDVTAVHLSRLLAEIAGLTRKHKGRLLLTKKAQSRLEKGEWLSLYQTILETALSQFNWSWLDHYQGLDGIQFVGPYGFWLLAQQGDEWRPVSEYLDEMLSRFPELANFVVSVPYASAEEVVASALRSRMITLYQLLGLVELSPHHRTLDPGEEQVMRRTVLFESLFR